MNKRRSAIGKRISLVSCETLGIIQPAQVFQRVQADMAVGADAPAAAGFGKIVQAKDAVAEIAFGAGTKDSIGAAFCKLFRFPRPSCACSGRCGSVRSGEDCPAAIQRVRFPR